LFEHADIGTHVNIPVTNRKNFISHNIAMVNILAKTMTAITIQYRKT
jgi:hypothetical protein